MTIIGYGSLSQTLTDGESTLDITLEKKTWDTCDAEIVKAPLDLAIIYFPGESAPPLAGWCCRQTVSCHAQRACESSRHAHVIPSHFSPRPHFSARMPAARR